VDKFQDRKITKQYISRLSLIDLLVDDYIENNSSMYIHNDNLKVIIIRNNFVASYGYIYLVIFRF
jgi:hypothetical protein